MQRFSFSFLSPYSRLFLKILQCSKKINMKHKIMKHNRIKRFKKMHENGDDKLLIADIFEDENLEELNISDVSKRKFNLNELRHIAVNFAATCENGYKGDFDSWFNGISSDW